MSYIHELLKEAGGKPPHETLNEACSMVDALRVEISRYKVALDIARGFVKECEEAEDRSNLDGDRAEVVLTCINEAAEMCLKEITAALDSTTL